MIFLGVMDFAGGREKLFGKSFSLPRPPLPLQKLSEKEGVLQLSVLQA